MTRRQEDASLVADATSGEGWIEWGGGNELGPLPRDAVVEVRFRDGYEHGAMTVGCWAGDGSPKNSNWANLGEKHDIIAYRVVGAA